MNETVSSIVARHILRPQSILETIERTLQRIRDADDPAIFISLANPETLVRQARALAEAGNTSLPLFGVPIAVKDNIDVAGFTTTAACPAFAYQPTSDATAVARLRAAGAIIIGKTNLDQFATGLVGVRSPYGVPRNPLRADLVPGGSSSGSAVAVARGIIPIALGTDTAGSGRVPAGLNNIVGLKPSCGLISTTGVVPACRSIDCISIFALTADDALAALKVMAATDPLDGYSRAFALGSISPLPPKLRIAVPRAADLRFFGDADTEAAFDNGKRILSDLGATFADVDLTPFFEIATMLYDGPWVAERTAAVGSFIAANPDAAHPVTRSIIEKGTKSTAVEAFRGMYRLAEVRAIARDVFRDVDALLVPTAPAVYTVAELAAEPIMLNSRLGTYTNFANLLDLAGFAVPCHLGNDGTAAGVTLLAPAGRDSELASMGAAIHAKTKLTLGALGVAQLAHEPDAASLHAGEIAIGVVGAHLSGMPLNHELKALGGRFLAATSTTPDYRLFALAGTHPPKPGLLRIATGSGSAIELETWALSAEGFGRFVANVPSPLSIGTIRLADGGQVHGFLVEPEGIVGARDVSSFGGWRAAMAANAKSG